MPYLQNETVGWLQFKHKKGKGGYFTDFSQCQQPESPILVWIKCSRTQGAVSACPVPPPPFFFVFHISLDASYHFEKLLRFLFLSYFIISLGYCQVDIKA